MQKTESVPQNLWTYTIKTARVQRPLSEAPPFQNGWIFGKVPKGGGGVISNPKIYVADFCHYKGVFRSWILEKIRNMIFRKWGGVNGRLELFRKFIRFGGDKLPLVSLERLVIWRLHLFKEWLEQQEGLNYTVVCLFFLFSSKKKTFKPWRIWINFLKSTFCYQTFYKVRPAGLTNGPKTESEIQVLFNSF